MAGRVVYDMNNAGGVARRLLVWGAAGALAVAALAPAQAGRVRVYGMGGSFSLPVTSLKEARWDTVVRQKYDFSCGSAAVATLLTYHYEQPTSEEDAFRFMFESGDQARIQQDGFSMLDMKRYLDSKGLRTDGFRITLDKLVNIGVPSIVMVNTKGYRHFVVLRGLKDGKVLLGDPAIGSVTIGRPEFEEIWNGIALAARGNLQIAREHFNDERDWAAWPTAPIQEGVSRTGLSMFTLTLPGRNEFGR